MPDFDPAESLIERLPATERYIARASIRIARSYGWRAFAFRADLPADATPRLDDLTATDADGKPHLLSELD